MTDAEFGAIADFYARYSGIEGLLVRRGGRAVANPAFWNALDNLIAASELVIDRPKDTRHPRYPELIYGVDYGYLADTRSMDGGGIDLMIAGQSCQPGGRFEHLAAAEAIEEIRDVVFEIFGTGNAILEL